MKKLLKNRKGITLIALVITIIVLLILAGVTISMLTGNNGLLNQTEKSVVLTEVAGIKEIVELNGINDDEKMSGKLSEIDVDISQDLVNKYDNILYVKESKLYLDFIAGFPSMQEYINNKSRIELLKDNMEICYDRIKTYNKLLNSSFDDGLNNYKTRMTPGNVTEIAKKDGNNYLHMEMYVSSGNTQWVEQEPTVANNYGEKIYVFAKYRNNDIDSEENHTINSPIWIARGGMGYSASILNSTTFINSYQKGWQNVSFIRIIEEKHGNFKLLINLGGNTGNNTTYEYSIDFDDLYMINLTELFGEGNEPTKEEMDAIFSNF